MECINRLPDLLPPPPLQLTGHALSLVLNEPNLHNGATTAATAFDQWTSTTLSKVLQKPDTVSLLLDAPFVSMLSDAQWETVLQLLQASHRNKTSVTEYHLDLRRMDPRHLYRTLECVRSLFHPQQNNNTGTNNTAATNDSGNEEVVEETWSQGHVQKLAIFGMTSQYAMFLSVLPKSLVELQLFFEEERLPGDEDERRMEEEDHHSSTENRQTRIEAMVQQYLATHPSLTSVNIKYTEDADDLLPISAFSLAALLSCPGMIKLEFERCSVASFFFPAGNHEEEAGGHGQDGDPLERQVPEQAVFQALRDNTRLFLLRFRSGSIQTSIAENIARALEIGNRSLRYLDLGDMEGVGETVAAGVTKAILRNTVLCGFEMNLNSIRDFQFTSLGNLTCMDVSDNYLRDEGALQLAQLIPSCRLERMNVADNCIGKIGGCAIAWALAHNNTLSKINICNNPLLSPDPDVGGGFASEITERVFHSFNETPAYQQGFLGMLCSSLRHNKTLTFINLSNVGLDDSHGPLLSILLRVGGLVGMGLLRNRIGDQACIYMCQALSKYNTTMRALMMELNPISARGFYAMWKGVLSTNDTLMNISWGNTTYMIKGVERGQRDLDIALKLNRAGMIRLRRNKNATKEEWVEALVQLRSDVDCSFTFLSENTHQMF